MLRYLLLLAMALTISAFAQPELAPPFQQPLQQPNRQGRIPGAGMNIPALAYQNTVELAVLPEGVFVLRGGVLARFTADTLQPAGIVQLFDPLPPRPEMPQNPTQEDRTALRDWMSANLAHNAPAATLAKDGKLYLVIGSACFRVNAATMQVDMKADLGAPDNNPRPAIPDGAPQLKLEGGVLYIVLGQELLTVEPDTGKVAARVALPAEMFPAVQGPMREGAPFADLNRGAGGRRNAQ